MIKTMGRRREWGGYKKVKSACMEGICVRSVAKYFQVQVEICLGLWCLTFILAAQPASWIRLLHSLDFF